MAKTVQCEKCGGVQAIFRDEDGGMKCAFCGEPIENLPPYEEGESLESDYLDEEGVKPEGEPAEAVFTLSRGEVERALILTGRLKPHRTTSIVETVLLAVLLVLQGSTVLGSLLHWKDAPDPSTANYLLLIVIIALIPAVWIMPRRTNRRIVDRSVSGNELRVRVYENLCEVFIPAEEKGWQFVFGSEKFTVSEADDMFVLSLSDGRLLALPKRGFAEGAEDIARERLTAAAGEMTPFSPKFLEQADRIRDRASAEKKTEVSAAPDQDRDGAPSEETQDSSGDGEESGK